MKNHQILEHYLEVIRYQFEQYKAMTEKAIEQVDDEMLYEKTGDTDNSIAIIMKHMTGNMLSRWTDFLTSDGEKPWRQRDKEFHSPPKSREDLLSYWEKGWSCLFQAVKGLSHKDLSKTVNIRSEPHSVLEALQRQLTHYAYHVGQIVFLAKQYSGNDWQSLSIPRGMSEEFNKNKNVGES